MKNLAIEELQKVLSDKKVKITVPQQIIADRLLQGWKLININQHHSSGGQTAWIVDETAIEPQIRHSGAAYKAFWGLNYSIRKVYPDFKLGANFWSQRNNIVGSI